MLINRTKNIGVIRKYIFIIFIIAIIVAVVYKINQDEETIPEEPTTSTVEEEIVKEVIFGVAEFDTMNPILSQNKYIQEISKIIYEPLLELDEEYKLQKCLAEDWAKTSETTYLIKIKDDIKWSDGTGLMVEDAIFTIQTLKQVPSIYASNVQNIINVEKVADDTVQITIDREIPFLTLICLALFPNENNFSANLGFSVLRRPIFSTVALFETK